MVWKLSFKIIALDCGQFGIGPACAVSGFFKKTSAVFGEYK